VTTPVLLLVTGLAVAAPPYDVAETREAKLKGLAGTHRLHLVPWADVPADG